MSEYEKEVKKKSPSGYIRRQNEISLIFRTIGHIQERTYKIGIRSDGLRHFKQLWTN